ncbi:hypothetical protein D3C84_285100 [compost metagenome]
MASVQQLRHAFAALLLGGVLGVALLSSLTLRNALAADRDPAAVTVTDLLGTPSLPCYWQGFWAWCCFIH